MQNGLRRAHSSISATSAKECFVPGLCVDLEMNGAEPLLNRLFGTGGLQKILEEKL